MRTQSFTWDGATITIRAATINDSIVAGVLQYLAGYDKETSLVTRTAISAWADFAAQTTADRAVPYLVADAENATPEECRAACGAWRALPRAFHTAWNKASRVAETTPGDPDLSPAASQKKETTPPSESSVNN